MLVVRLVRLKMVIEEDFDALRFVNWLVVSYYWIYLADVGQTAPTIYEERGRGLSTSMENVNLMQPPTVFKSTNNIFINRTLFDIYDTYSRDKLFPLLRHLDSRISRTLPEFRIPNNTSNQRVAERTKIRQIYLCTIRHMETLSSIVSVVSSVHIWVMAIVYNVICALMLAAESRRRHSQNEIIAELPVCDVYNPRLEETQTSCKSNGTRWWGIMFLHLSDQFRGWGFGNIDWWPLISSEELTLLLSRGGRKYQWQCVRRYHSVC
jgi:hypothetical protein